MKYKFIYDKLSKTKPAFPGTSPLISEILYSRGITTEKEAKDFIKTPSYSDITFENLKDEDKAAKIIKSSIEAGERIVLYTDTDADGAMCAVVGMLLLKKLGANVAYFTNDKFKDGYGFCESGLERLLTFFPDTKLIITADNGIAAKDTQLAKDKGIKVVITDHHEAKDFIPVADAVVDPKQPSCPSTFKEYCGAGVLYIVLRKVYLLLGHTAEETYFTLKYVALATVADIVPLLNNNRSIVKAGLNDINTDRYMPFNLIKDRLLSGKEINSESIAYYIGPMINSVARITGDITPAISFFLEADRQKKESLLTFLISTNEKRKTVTTEQLSLAMSLAEKELNNKIVIVYSEVFHEGILGILAGKIKEEYNLPAIVLGGGKDGLYIGSARSIEGIDIKAEISKVEMHLAKFGGHKMAAGLSVKKENYEVFKKEALKVFNSLDENLFTKKIVIDAVVKASDLTEENVKSLKILEPFGAGFPAPRFGYTFNVTEEKFMGGNATHLKLIDSVSDTSVICWNGADTYKRSPKPLRKAIGHPELNTFNGKTSVQFMVENNMLFPG